MSPAQDPVTVVGYPIGGETISVTSGVVSRVEVIIPMDSLRSVERVHRMASIDILLGFVPDGSVF